MPNPDALTPRPSFFLAVLGGLVGMILLSALIFLAPVFGFPFVDFPRLIGGVLTAQEGAAFWVGFWLYFLVGAFFFAPLLAYVWPALPGREVGFIGAAIKGLIWGLILWVLSGLLLPLMGWLNRLPEIVNPGLFSLNLGLMAALGILLGHLAYGLAVGIIAMMGQGVEPINTLGWKGIGKADIREIILSWEERDMPEEAMGRRVP